MGRKKEKPRFCGAILFVCPNTDYLEFPVPKGPANVMRPVIARIFFVFGILNIG